MLDAITLRICPAFQHLPGAELVAFGDETITVPGARPHYQTQAEVAATALRAKPPYERWRQASAARQTRNLIWC